MVIIDEIMIVLEDSFFVIKSRDIVRKGQNYKKAKIGSVEKGFLLLLPTFLNGI